MKLRLAQAAVEHGQRPLEFHAVPCSIGIAAGDEDGLQREVHRQRQRLIEAQAPHHAAQGGGGEDVACAVVGSAVAVVEVGEKLPRLAVVGHAAQGVGCEGNACQHYFFRTQGSHCLQKVADIRLVIRRAVLPSRHQASLGDVGDGNVGPRHHLRHLGGELGAKGGVELAVIRHGGINEQQRVLVREQVNDGEHRLHLLRGGEVARIDSVEMDVLGFPVLGNGQQFSRQIGAGKAGEHGVCAQYGGGHDAALHPHGGQHRQRHGEGAAPDTGNILNTDNAFHIVSSRFLTIQQATVYRLCGSMKMTSFMLVDNTRKREKVIAPRQSLW